VLFCAANKVSSSSSVKNRTIFRARVFCVTADGVSLELGTGAWTQKARMMGLSGRKRSLTMSSLFSLLDTIHERDGQTDGQTPGFSKDRAYA